jgi:hypothetical protein
LVDRLRAEVNISSRLVFFELILEAIDLIRKHAGKFHELSMFSWILYSVLEISNLINTLALMQILAKDAFSYVFRYDHQLLAESDNPCIIEHLALELHVIQSLVPIFHQHIYLAVPYGHFTFEFEFHVLYLLVQKRNLTFQCICSYIYQDKLLEIVHGFRPNGHLLLLSIKCKAISKSILKY